MDASAAGRGRNEAEGDVLDFRVLGPFEVVVDGAVVPTGGPQQRSVLALLALRANEVVATDAIVDGLWGETVPPSAVGVVRNYVSRLRRVLAVTGRARLSSRPPGYVLDTEARHVDAVRFAHLVGRARHEREAGSAGEASATLRQALGLWRGPVLADLMGLDSLRPTVAHLEEMRLDAVESRVDAELTLGRHAELVGELRALTQQHPLRERLWGQRILALYRCGRQADALATYHEACATLMEDVGVGPGPELQALEQQVRRHADELRWHGPASGSTVTLGRSDGVPLQAALAPSSDDTLVGRAEERALLAQRLDAMAAGRFRAVLVAGPPGIGKSALVRWAAGAAHGRGATVTGGWADEGSCVPFRPLDEAVGHWAAHVAAPDLHRLADADAAQLAPVVPRLAERRGAPRPTLRPGNDLDRQRLFDAVVRWVEVLAARQPAVVVLEDIHWADPAALLAACHLLRHPPSAGVLLLMTYRDSETRRPEALARLLASTRGHHDVDRIDLTSLSDEDVLELLGEPVSSPHEAAARRFAVELNHRTGGNPLFVHETLHHLRRQRAIDSGDGWVTEQPLEAYGVPPGVADLLDERLGRLPTATRAVLQRAAVLGQPFGVPLLSRTVDRPEIEIVEALEPALAAGLVVEADSQATTPSFGFSHALVREAILDGLPLSRLLHTHWRAGLALAALSASNPGPQLGEVARHLAAGAQAGDLHAALAACVRAGQHALSSVAFEAASGHFTTAVDLLGRLTDADTDTDPDLVYAAWLGLGHASAALNDTDRQQDGFLRAVTVAREHRWPNSLAFLVIGLAVYRMAVGPRRPGDESLTKLVDEAHGTLGPTPSLERCCLLAVMSVRAVMKGQRGQADDLAARSAETAAAVASPTAAAMALMARGWTLVGSPDHEALRSVGEQALSWSFDAAPEVALPLRHFVVPLLALPALQAGNREELESVRARARADREMGSDPQVANWWLVFDATLALCRGRFDEVARLTVQLDATGWAIWQGAARWQRGLAEIEQRRHAEVVTVATAALADVVATSSNANGARALLASLHTTAGNRADAAHHLEVLREQLRLDEPGGDVPFVLRHLAEITVHRSDDVLAAELLPVLLRYSGQMLVTGTGISIEAAADRAIGQLLLTLGRTGEAIEHLAAGLALERSFGAAALATRTAYWHARALLTRRGPGDVETAHRLLDEASSAARRLGMAQLGSDIAALT